MSLMWSRLHEIENPIPTENPMPTAEQIVSMNDEELYKQLNHWMIRFRTSTNWLLQYEALAIGQLSPDSDKVREAIDNPTHPLVRYYKTMDPVFASLQELLVAEMNRRGLKLPWEYGL